jgi:hypothetical protein
VNSNAELSLSNAISLNSSTTELVDDVAMATDEVDALDQAVADDRDAIATVTCVANDTIVLAEDVLGRIQQISVSKPQNRVILLTSCNWDHRIFVMEVQIILIT